MIQISVQKSPSLKNISIISRENDGDLNRYDVDGISVLFTLYLEEYFQNRKLFIKFKGYNASFVLIRKDMIKEMIFKELGLIWKLMTPFSVPMIRYGVEITTILSSTRLYLSRYAQYIRFSSKMKYCYLQLLR